MTEQLKMSPKQKNYYLNSTAKINISHGAVRSGKTFITNLRWLEYILEGPKGKLLMSGKTKQTVKDNVLTDLFELVGEGNYRYLENKGELTIFGRKIKVVGASDISSEGTIRGQTYAGWYGDEITIQHPTFVKQAITRCSVAGAQIFWTTNPDHPKHYIKTDYIDDKEMEKKGQVRTWHFLLTDNATLTEDYKELLKASFSGVFYKRNIDGLWVIAEGVVYGEDYKRELHRVSNDEISKMIAEKAFKEYIGGVDWGYTHPMVGLVVGITSDNKYYVIDEFYKTQQKTEALSNWLLKWEEKLEKKLRVIFCDSAEPDRMVELQDKELRATGANKEIGAGINSVQTAFKNDRLFISEECENTDNELQTYRYPNENDTEALQRKDQPIDEDNHAMDALRYLVHNYELYLKGQKKRQKRRSTREEKRAKLAERKQKRRKNSDD